MHAAPTTARDPGKYPGDERVDQIVQKFMAEAASHESGEAFIGARRLADERLTQYAELRAERQ